MDEKKPNYPIEKIADFGKIFEKIFFLIGCFVIMCAGLFLVSALPGVFFTFIGLAFIIIFVIVALSILMQIRESVYVVDCPYCSRSVHFPVDEEGYACSRCEQRMIMVNGVVQKIEK